MRQPELPPSLNIYTKENIDQLLLALQDLELNKKLAEIDKDYPYWDAFRRKVKGLPKNPDFLWAFNQITRNKTVSKIVLNDKLKGCTFRFNTTSKILKYLHQFDLHLGGVLEGRSIIPPDEKNRYLISSIMEEAIASSQLEGAATTREIAKQMLRDNRKPNTHSEKMILNNYLTIKKVLEIKDLKMTRELILELHALVSKDTLNNKDNEGRFRTTSDVNVVDDMTGEVFYIPPPHEEVEVLMNSFCDFANSEADDTNFVHPIIRGIILHFLVGYIHPFVDGNGRTARALFYWYIMSKGYWLVEYMSISKIIIQAPAQYARAYLYAEHDQNDLTYFIEYNLKCMDLALKNLQLYIKRKVMEKQNLYNLIQNENVNERQAELLRGLIVDNKKGFTIKEVQSRFGVVYQTARTDLLGLQDLGYIKEKKFGKKLIFFKVDEFDKKMESLMSEKL